MAVLLTSMRFFSKMYEENHSSALPYELFKAFYACNTECTCKVHAFTQLELHLPRTNTGQLQVVHHLLLGALEKVIVKIVYLKVLASNL